MDLAIIPVPIIAAKETPNAINPPLATKFNRAGVRKTATALPAVSPIDAPKYAYVSLQTNLKFKSSFGGRVTHNTSIFGEGGLMLGVT